MKYTFKLSAISLAVFLHIIASVAHATQSPAGYWLATSPFFGDTPVAVIKTYLTKQKLLCGEIVKIIPLNGAIDSSGKFASSGPIMMCGYHEKNGRWVGGKLYEQITAKIHSSTVMISDDGNRLYVRGWKGPFFRTSTWVRIK